MFIFNASKLHSIEQINDIHCRFVCLVTEMFIKQRGSQSVARINENIE